MNIPTPDVVESLKKKMTVQVCTAAENQCNIIEDYISRCIEQDVTDYDPLPTDFNWDEVEIIFEGENDQDFSMMDGEAKRDLLLGMYDAILDGEDCMIRFRFGYLNEVEEVYFFQQTRLVLPFYSKWGA